MKGLCHDCFESGKDVTVNESGVTTCGCHNNDEKEK